jgi:hypothetical protein
VVILGPPTGDGGVCAVNHRPDHTITTGVLRSLEDGRPLDGDVVRLTPREGGIGYNKEVLYSRSGPAMVNSREYLDGWESVFGKKTATGQA